LFAIADNRFLATISCARPVGTSPYNRDHRLQGRNVTDPQTTLASILRRPDFGLLAAGIDWVMRDELAAAFEIRDDRSIHLRRDILGSAPAALLHMRHALELSWLLQDGTIAAADAGLAAARTAVRFAVIEGLGSGSRELGPWAEHFSASTAPPTTLLDDAWLQLRAHQLLSRATPAPASWQALTGIWPLLGPVEAILETGGDVRLRVDPASGLNAYGSSHRPRPWAITFASSTASSISERGYLGAEATRRRVTLAALAGQARSALAAEIAAAKAGIGDYYGLAPDAEVVLAASGTDGELYALALALLHPGGKDLTNLLIAPEETGSGVPLAAVGKHFAIDTSRGTTVDKGTLIEGFSPRTRLATVRVREPDGSVRSPAAVDADCAQEVAGALAAGRRAMLHLLDVSKTGLLAPTVDCVRAIGARHGNEVDVVVDACQARVTPETLRGYIDAGWMVLVTGSKFFTGPPFAGAVLVPAAIAGRLRQGMLPAGLAAYAGRFEWPSDAAAAASLPDGGNYGLLLRWRAALAEMQAFAAVPAERRRAILRRFTASVQDMIAANADLRIIGVPALARTAAPEDGTRTGPETSAQDWDSLGTILSFCVLGPADDHGVRLPIAVADARQIYQWLNADLLPALGPFLAVGQQELASCKCHIGQPAPVSAPGGAVTGALRISAGARLVSGEPSHAGLDEQRRLDKEIASVQTILDKISLIVRHRERLRAADPQPSFR
jgi:hypothetical protein